MSENEALAFIRQALTDMRTDIRDLSKRVEDFMAEADTRLAIIESKCVTCVGLQNPKQATGIKALLEQVSWLPTAWKLVWPLCIILGLLWRTAPPETKAEVKKVAASSMGVDLPKIKDTASDVLSAASVKANARYWVTKESAQVYNTTTQSKGR